MRQISWGQGHPGHVDRLTCVSSVLQDLGIDSGLARIVQNLPAIRAADVVIVVSGMDGSLPSAIAGLVDSPVVSSQPPCAWNCYSRSREVAASSSCVSIAATCWCLHPCRSGPSTHADHVPPGICWRQVLWATMTMSVPGPRLLCQPAWDTAQP